MILSKRTIIFIAMHLCGAIFTLAFKSGNYPILKRNAIFSNKRTILGLMQTNKAKTVNNNKQKHAAYDHSNTQNSNKRVLDNILASLNPSAGVIGKAKINKELIDLIHKLSSDELTHLILSLGNIKALVKNQGTALLNEAIIGRLSQLNEVISGPNLSTSLAGIAKLGIKFNSLSQRYVEQNDHIMRRREVFPPYILALTRTAKQMNPAQLSETLWAFGKIGIVWDSLPLRMQTEISASIAKYGADLTPQSVANTIHGLSNMKSKWSLLPPPIALTLIDGLHANLYHMKAQELSNCISGLGKLDAQWITLPLSMRHDIQSVLLNSIEGLGPVGLAMLTHGLGRMNANIDSLSLEFKKSYMDSIISTAPKLNSHEVANMLYGLGKMQAGFSNVMNNSSTSRFTMPNRVRKVLLDAFAREAPFLTSQGVSNSLWGLMRMKIQWSTLSTSQKVVIRQAITKEHSRMDEQEIANTIFALGNMGLSWKKDLGPESFSYLIQSFEENIDVMTLPGIVMSLNGIGKMNCTWSSLPTSFKDALNKAGDRLLRVSSEQTLSSFIHALTELKVRWQHLSPLLQASIEECISRSSWDLLLDGDKKAISDESYRSDALDLFASSTELNSVDKKLGKSNWMVTTPRVSAFYLSKMDSTAAAAMLLSLPEIDASKSSLFQHNSTGQMSSSASSNSHKYFLGTNAKKLGALADDFSGGNTHYIYSLNALGVQWKDLSVSTRFAIFQSLVVNLRHLNEQGVVNALFALSSMSVKWHELSSKVKEAFVEALMRVSSSASDRGISVVILAFARLEVHWETDLPDNLQASLRSAIGKQSSIGEHALSNILYGLGKMSRKWSDIHPPVRKTLLAALVVCHLNNFCTPKGITNIIYGLAQMQAEWSKLSSSVRLALVNDIIKVLPTTTDSQFSSIISSLAKAKASWEYLPKELTETILEKIRHRASSFSEHHVSNIIYGLGKMGLNWRLLGVRYQEHLVRAIVRLSSNLDIGSTQMDKKNNMQTDENCDSDPQCDLSDSSSGTSFTPQGVSMLLSGLCGMGVTWTNLPSTAIDAILCVISRLSLDMNSAQLSMILQGLHKLSFRWDQLNDLLKRRLMTSVSRIVLGGNNATHIMLTINSLGNMGLSLSKFESDLPGVSRIYFKAVQKVLRLGSSDEVSGLVLGVGLMECPWATLPAKVRADFINSLLRNYYPRKHKPKESFMSRRQSEKRNMPTPISDVSSSISVSPSQRIANTAYGLSLMIFDMNNGKMYQELLPVHLAIFNSISSIGVAEFTEAEKEQVAIYAHVLETVLKLNLEQASMSSSDNLMFYMRSQDDFEKPKESFLQQSVISSLTAALKTRNDDLMVQKEFSSFDGVFPVDATVFEDGEPVAFVEIDGPQHFSCGVLRRKDIMKEQLYRSKHPCASFTRVSYDQVDHLGSKYVGFEVANFITLSMHTCNSCPLDDAANSTAVSAEYWESSSTLPEYFHTDSWVARQARLGLDRALDWQRMKRLRSSKFYMSSPLVDFAFADYEEDNS